VRLQTPSPVCQRCLVPLVGPRLLVPDHVRVEGDEKGIDSEVCSEKCREELSKFFLVLPHDFPSPDVMARNRARQAACQHTGRDPVGPDGAYGWQCRECLFVERFVELGPRAVG
jgi:hypothetical protein